MLTPCLLSSGRLAACPCDMHHVPIQVLRNLNVASPLKRVERWGLGLVLGERVVLSLIEPWCFSNLGPYRGFSFLQDWEEL